MVLRVVEAASIAFGSAIYGLLHPSAKRFSKVLFGLRLNGDALHDAI